MFTDYEFATNTRQLYGLSSGGANKRQRLGKRSSPCKIISQVSSRLKLPSPYDLRDKTKGVASCFLYPTVSNEVSKDGGQRVLGLEDLA